MPWHETLGRRMPEAITLDTVKATVLRLCAERPTMTNPRDAEGCFYTDPSDHDTHCLVGQVFVELGLPVPGPDCQLGVMTLVADRPRFYADLTDEAVVFLTNTQQTADDYLRTWGSVGALIRNGQIPDQFTSGIF